MLRECALSLTHNNYLSLFVSYTFVLDLNANLARALALDKSIKRRKNGRASLYGENVCVLCVHV